MAVVALWLAILTGCAGGVFGTAGPDYSAPASTTAERWQAPLFNSSVAHEGSAQRLSAWWAQFNDAALDALIAAAQAQSSTLAQAAATIERARADAIAAGVAASPSVDGIASSNRSAFTLGGPATLRTQSLLGVQSRWEIDLFGGLARERESRQATLASKLALWHDARVSLAAEVAGAYFNLRYCEIQVTRAEAETRSRGETARITAAAERAGMQAASTVALVQSAAADAAGALAQRRAQCDISIKGLVALTAMDEPVLRTLLGGSARTGVTASAPATGLPEPSMFRIDALPVRVLAQRPDIAAAERQLAAASADIGSAEAARFPRLTLSGNITPTRIAIGNAPALSLTTWSIGPSLEVPLLDGGRRSANVEAVRAQYAAAESAYRARVRNAVREVEEALVRLASAATQLAESESAARGYRANLAAAQSMLRTGLGSALQVEEARRPSLAADAAVAALTHERLAAWITLYRAAGGGWEPDAPAASRN